MPLSWNEIKDRTLSLTRYVADLGGGEHLPSGDGGELLDGIALL